METYKIAIRFRERNFSGYVQKFDDHYDVFFQDEELLQPFGGVISYDSNKKFKSARPSSADDTSKFYKIVGEQLK